MMHDCTLHCTPGLYLIDLKYFLSKLTFAFRYLTHNTSDSSHFHLPRQQAYLLDQLHHQQGGVHQADPAGDAHEEEHAGGEHEDGHGHVDEEFEHGLTLDQSEKYYWSFSVQQWFPLAMNENGDFYWHYPEQIWSRFK